MRMQECQTSPIQTPIELKSYINDGSTYYIPNDMVMDSSLNKYLVSFNDFAGNIFVSKINPAGDLVWSKEYPNIIIVATSMSTYITNDGSTIRFYGRGGNATGQYVQISTCKYYNITSNASINILYQICVYLLSSNHLYMTFVKYSWWITKQCACIFIL